MKVTRIFDLLERYSNEFSEKQNAFVSKIDGKWESISSKKYIEDSYSFCYGLMELGYKKGDKIATISHNCPEWNIVDMGMSMLGVVHVPIFNTLSEEEYKYIFKHSEVKSVFVASKIIYDTVVSALEGVDNTGNVYCFKSLEGIPFWEEVIELGKKNADKYKSDLEEIKSDITEEDFATLIYTSGTTGVSKGVMLSHKNLVQNFLAAAKIFALTPEDKYLSILPLCHVGGRMGNYQTQYSGCSLYYAESMTTIAKNMKEIKPNGFDAVPRILEKIYDTIISKGNNLTGMKKKIFFWSVKTGLNYDVSKSSFYRMKLKIADKLIFSKWRDAIGGNVRLVGCGGASLQPRLERVFWACGIKVLNMYGLTETSPIITINRIDKSNVKLGSVGCLIDGVDMKIAEDGEILCKGHNVMIGYYKNPDLTAEVFDKDGWFCTGDIGRIEGGKFLYVTDRKKEMFKLSNGKYVAPQSVEGRLKESIFVDQVMVVGEHEKFASAIISPNFSSINEWCKDNDISYDSKEELVKSPELIKMLSAEVIKTNKTLSAPEKIMRFKLVPDEWTPCSGELSPTLKLKRKFIDQKYQSVLSEIYSKSAILI
jgi:long-chain acyl-CoA synthetase